MSVSEICPICGRVPESAGSTSLETLAKLKRAVNAETLGVMLPGVTSIRAVAITVLIQSDATCIEIARAMHAILADAGVTGYELGVAPVEGK